MNLDTFFENNSIFICEDNYKNKILEKLTKNKKLLDIKFFSKKEFFNNYFFSYDEKAIYYLVKKYNIKIDIAKMYLKNLYYIDEKKIYKSEKLNKLVDLKKELIENNMLIYNNDFERTLINKKVIVIGYDCFDNYEINVLNNLNAKFFDNYNQNKLNCVIEFKTLNDEVDYVANSIAKLLQKGIDINKIKICGVDKEYYNELQKIFRFFNIPIKIPSNKNLLSLKITKDFLNNYQSDIVSSIECIKYNDSKIANKIVDVCNKYYFVDDYLNAKSFIEYDLKNIIYDNFNLKNYIEIVDYNYPFEDDEYVFFMNFNSSSIPKIIKDENYITDNIKNEINEKPTYLINKEIKLFTIKILESIKNLVITFKRQTLNSEYYPSTLINELGLEIIKVDSDIYNSYSVINDKLNFGRAIDKYNKYGIISDDYVIYNSNYDKNEFGSYSNKYTKINKNDFKDYINNKLVLSYSSLNNYNKCSFRYYLANILKIDKYEEKFETFTGSLFHDVLEKCCDGSMDIDEEIDLYLLNNKKDLNMKETFFINKLRRDIKDTVEILKKQKSFTSLDKAKYEQNIVVDKSKDIEINFVGYIDKILYKENNNNTLISIIDYKTGYVDIELKYLPYGLSLQLPIYLYLVKKSSLFKNPIFLGFYLQYVLDKDILIDKNKTYLLQKEDNLKLMGYSLDVPELIEYFDSTYANSQLIKSMKLKNDGSFYSSSKVLSENQINKIIELTESNIDKSINNILNCKFDINPKKIGFFEDVGCKYCKFCDICYKKENDYVILDNIDNLDFLEEDADAKLD